MEITVFALACLATIYTMMVLIPYNFLTYLLDQSRRRPKVMHTSMQPAQSNFALKKGQTIVAQFIAVCRRSKRVSMSTRSPRKGLRLCKR
jgi:hypothetical protein